MPFIEIHPPLVVSPWESWMPSACWYLVNLPRPVAIVLAKLRGLIPGYWSAGTGPRSPGPPTGWGEGGRRDRGGPNKNTTWHPHGKQPTYWQPASGAQHTAFSIHILMMANSEQRTHNAAYTQIQAFSRMKLVLVIGFSSWLRFWFVLLL